MSTAPLPDAARQNWVDRYAPEGLKPWLKLGRFDRPIGIWLLLLPGWQGIMLALNQYDRPFGGYELWLIAGFAIGAALMRGAGCAVNDIVDRDFDAQVARTALRPIPAGQISVKQAWAFVAGLCLISLCILLTMNLTSVVLGALSLGLVAAYPFMKRITWWPQAWLGLTFNWGALMGFAAAVYLAAFPTVQAAARDMFPLLETTFGRNPWFRLDANLMTPSDVYMRPVAFVPAILLYLGGVFWTLGYDTIYALQDIEDDAMVGVKSTARRLGRSAARGVGLFYGMAVLLAAMAGAAAGLGPLFYAVVVVYAAHLAWQVRSLRLDDPALALKLFKSNREAGFILLAAVAVGWIPF